MFDHINTLPALLVNYQWSREQKWYRARSKHSVFTHFPKDPNCDICLWTKITRASCRAEIFGDLIIADHKVLSDGCESRNNHRYAVCGTRLGKLSGNNPSRVKVLGAE